MSIPLYRGKASLPLRRLCEAWAPEIGGGTTPDILAAELRAAGVVRRGAVARADALAFARERDIAPPRWWWEERDAWAEIDRKFMRPFAALTGQERDEPVTPPASLAPAAPQVPPARPRPAARAAIETAVKAYIRHELATPSMSRCCDYVRRQEPGARRDQIRAVFRDTAGSRPRGRPPGGKWPKQMAGK